MRFEHPVFQGPRSVSPLTVEETDPHTGEQVDVWYVQSEDETPGLVASRRRFVDAPDSEILSGGINSKGRRGVPLVREGNLLLWGFSAAPDKLTEAGRAALVNALVYMRGFDGQVPTRRAGVATRDSWSLVLDSPYIDGDDLYKYFGPGLLAKHGEDKEALRADLAEREDYLHVAAGSATLRIDADAEELGQPTDSLALIRAALEAGDELGARVLERYWPNDDLVVTRPTTVAELDALADQVVFSESEGYRWLSRPAVAGPEAWEVAETLASLDLPRPSELAPAVFGARLVGSYYDAEEELTLGSPLSVVELAVRAEVLRGWHVTLASEDGAYTSVSIDVELPDGMRWLDDEFTLDGRTRERKGALHGRGRLTWTRALWLVGEPGEYEVRGTIRFQACDEEKCLPPQEVEFTTTLLAR